MITISNYNQLAPHIDLRDSGGTISGDTVTFDAIEDVLSVFATPTSPVMLEVDDGAVSHYHSELAALLTATLSSLGLALFPDSDWSTVRGFRQLTLWEIVKVELAVALDCADVGEAGFEVATVSRTVDGVTVTTVTPPITITAQQQVHVTPAGYWPSSGDISSQIQVNNPDLEPPSNNPYVAFFISPYDADAPTTHTKPGNNNEGVFVDMRDAISSYHFGNHANLGDRKVDLVDVSTSIVTVNGRAFFDVSCRARFRWRGFGDTSVYHDFHFRYGFDTLPNGNSACVQGFKIWYTIVGSNAHSEDPNYRYLHKYSIAIQVAPGFKPTLARPINAMVPGLSSPYGLYVEGQTVSIPSSRVRLVMSGLRTPTLSALPSVRKAAKLPSNITTAGSFVAGVRSNNDVGLEYILAVTPFDVEAELVDEPLDFTEYVAMYDSFNTTQIMQLPPDSSAIRSAFVDAVHYDVQLLALSRDFAKALLADVYSSMIDAKASNIRREDGTLEMLLPHGVDPDTPLPGITTPTPLTWEDCGIEAPDYSDAESPAQLADQLANGIIPQEYVSDAQSILSDERASDQVTIRTYLDCYGSTYRALELMNAIRSLTVHTYVAQLSQWIDATTSTVADVIAAYNTLRDRAFEWFDELAGLVVDDAVASSAVHEAKLATDQDLNTAMGMLMDAAKASTTDTRSTLLSLELAGEIDMRNSYHDVTVLEDTILASVADGTGYLPDAITLYLMADPVRGGLELDEVQQTCVEIVNAISNGGSPSGQVVNLGSGANILSPALVRTQVTPAFTSDIPECVNTLYMPFNNSILVLARPPVRSGDSWYAYWYPRFSGGSDYDAAQAYLLAWDEFKSVVNAAGSALGVAFSCSFPTLVMDGETLTSARLSRKSRDAVKYAKHASNKAIAAGYASLLGGTALTAMGYSRLEPGKAPGINGMGFSAGLGLIGSGSVMAAAGIITAATGGTDWASNVVLDPEEIVFEPTSMQSCHVTLGTDRHEGYDATDLMLAIVVWACGQGAYKPINSHGPLADTANRWVVGSWDLVCARYQVVADNVSKSPLLWVAGAGLLAGSIGTYVSYRKLQPVRVKSYVPGVIAGATVGVLTAGVKTTASAVKSAASYVDSIINPEPTVSSNAKAIAAIAGAVAVIGGASLTLSKVGVPSFTGVKSVAEQVGELDLNADQKLVIYER